MAYETPRFPGQFWMPATIPLNSMPTEGQGDGTAASRSIASQLKKTAAANSGKMPLIRDKYISELETNYDNILRSNLGTSRLTAINNFMKGLDTTREAYERIDDPAERRDTLARFDAVVEKIKAKPKGGRKSRKPKKGKKVRKTRRLVRK
jgi:hypothetical protein